MKLSSPPPICPLTVLDKLSQLAPGAEVEEAAVVSRDGVESYEVAYLDAAGQEWEANLRV